MGDEVGVEPERLNKVASALESLRDVLAANAPEGGGLEIQRPEGPHDLLRGGQPQCQGSGTA